MPGSLEGLRILDITTSVAGPFATLILGDLGADVIKIERPEKGDDTRKWGPPFWEGESCHFLTWNRGKRSVTLDYKTEEGFRQFLRLAEQADVLVQNLRPGAMEAAGLGYEDLRKINPRLIYCSMSGFGSGGPLESRSAYDPLMQAFSGLMSMTGDEGHPPVRIPVSILDQGTGMWAALAVLDALRTRDVTGEGILVETSLLTTALMWEPTQIASYLASGETPKRLGSGIVGIYPYGAFPTADGYIVISAGNDTMWEEMCRATGMEDLMLDPRFADNPSRVDHRGELLEAMSGYLSSRGTDEWVQKLTAVKVPCSPIQELDAVLAHEQVKAIGAIQRVEGSRIPDYQAVSLPIRWHQKFPPINHMAPELGEHTDELLNDGPVWPLRTSQPAAANI